MLLFYLRHGDPIYEPDSLTELGHKQAEALSHRLALYGLDEIYSSDSIRAMQTAKPTCEALGKEPTLLSWANEGITWNYFTIKREDGSKPWAFFLPEWIKKFNDPEVKALNENWHTHPYFRDTKFTEGVNFINGKVDEFLLSLGFKHDRKTGLYEVVKKNDKRVALFAHQGMGLSVLSSILDIPYPLFCTHFDMEHSGMSVIYFNENEPFTVPKLLQLSNDSHLYKENLLTGYNKKMDF